MDEQKERDLHRARLALEREKALKFRITMTICMCVFAGIMAMIALILFFSA